MGKNKIKVIVLIGILLFTVCGCKNGGLLGWYKDENKELMPVKLTQPDSSIVLDLPFDIKNNPRNEPINDEVKDFVESAVRYTQKNDKLMVNIVYSKYDTKLFEKNVQGKEMEILKDGIANDTDLIKSHKEYTHVEVKTTVIPNLGTASMKMVAIYQYQGKTIKSTFVYVLDNNNQWLIIYDALNSDKTAQAIIEQSISSVRLGKRD